MNSKQVQGTMKSGRNGKCGSEKIKLQCFAKDKKSINGNFLAYIGLLKDQFIYIGNNYLSNLIYHFQQNYFGIE